MEEVIGNRTWSIHPITIFSSIPITSSNIPSITENATLFLRQNYYVITKQQTILMENDYDTSGDYVTLTILDTSKVPAIQSCDKISSDQRFEKSVSSLGSPSNKKRSLDEISNLDEIIPIGNLNQTQINSQQLLTCSDKHLHIDIRIQDQSVADIIVCFLLNHIESSTSELQTSKKTVTTKTNDKKNGSKATKTSTFGLVRGTKSSIQIMFQWLREVLFVNVAANALTLSPCDLAYVASQTAEEALSMMMKSAASLTPIDESNGSKKKEKEKSFVLTFQAPAAIISAGLQNLVIAIPFESLKQLVVNLNRSSDIPHIRNNTTNGDEECTTTLQLMEGIEHFIMETFCIDVQSFHLMKVSNHIITISHDGRFKPLLNIPRLLQILNEIK